MIIDFDRSAIQDIIFKAEITSVSIGVSYIELLEKYGEELKNEKPSMATKIIGISRQLKSGKKRWDVYKAYVESDVIELLKMAEKRTIPAGTIINSYVPAKTLTTKYRNNIKRNLISPIAGAFFITTLLGYAVLQFKKPAEDGMVQMSDGIMFIVNNYYYLNYGFIAFMAVLLFSIPHKLPMLNRIFQKLDSMLALATVEAMMQVGYATADIIPAIKKQFNIEYEPTKRNIDGLTGMLKFAKFITPEESAELKISTTHDDPKKPVQRIISERYEEAHDLSKSIGSTIGTISLIITAGPIVMMVVVMIAFLAAAAAAGQSLG